MAGRGWRKARSLLFATLMVTVALPGCVDSANPMPPFPPIRYESDCILDYCPERIEMASPDGIRGNAVLRVNGGLRAPRTLVATEAWWAWGVERWDLERGGRFIVAFNRTTGAITQSDAPESGAFAHPLLVGESVLVQHVPPNEGHQVWRLGANTVGAAPLDPEAHSIGFGDGLAVYWLPSGDLALFDPVTNVTHEVATSGHVVYSAIPAQGKLFARARTADGPFRLLQWNYPDQAEPSTLVSMPDLEGFLLTSEGIVSWTSTHLALHDGLTISIPLQTEPYPAEGFSGAVDSPFVSWRERITKGDGLRWETAVRVADMRTGDVRTVAVSPVLAGPVVTGQDLVLALLHFEPNGENWPVVYEMAL